MERGSTPWRLSHPRASLFVPDGTEVEPALSRTTHMGIGAHPDDLEFMTWHGILECFHRPDRWFCGVTVTDGGGSPRDRDYAGYSDEDMRRVRLVEQRHAAVIGEYGAMASLMYPSEEVRGGGRAALLADLQVLLEAACPEVVYTHSLADRHETHVAVSTAVLEALRALPAEAHPRAVYGCEGWGSLDWLTPEDRVTFDVGSHPNLTMALMGVYDSQISGGKRYDLATAGRKRANATYADPYSPDRTECLELAMDLTPLVRDPEIEPADYVQVMLDRAARAMRERILRYAGGS